MITRDERRMELELMSCMQLLAVFEKVVGEGNVIGFPLKACAINSIVENEFKGAIPAPLPTAKPKRQLASAK